MDRSEPPRGDYGDMLIRAMCNPPEPDETGAMVAGIQRVGPFIPPASRL